MFADLRKLVFLVIDELNKHGAVTLQYITDGISSKAHVQLNGYKFVMSRVNPKYVRKTIKEAVEKYFGKLEPQEAMGNYKIWANYHTFYAENTYRTVQNGTVLEGLDIEVIRK